jgi:hypothetical protein
MTDGNKTENQINAESVTLWMVDSWPMEQNRSLMP